MFKLEKYQIYEEFLQNKVHKEVILCFYSARL